MLQFISVPVTVCRVLGASSSAEGACYLCSGTSVGSVPRSWSKVELAYSLLCLTYVEVVTWGESCLS